MTLYGHQALERAVALVQSRLGIALDDRASRERLVQVLTFRMRESGCDGLDAWLEGWRSPAQEALELRAIADALTVPESFFFRSRDQIRVFANVVVPDRLDARCGTPVRVLSAGCAGGEEPYTLAMAADTVGPLSVLGIDVSARSLERGRRGRYMQWALRETTADEQDRFFVRDGRELVLDQAIRSRVEFQERNLAQDDAGFWAPGSFDVIFCRNVFIYLRPDAIRAIVQRFERALAPDGFLFLGHAETLRGVPTRFELRHVQEAFFYQLGAEDGDRAVQSR